MAPAMLVDTSSSRDGHLLEETSDHVDAVNVLRAQQLDHGQISEDSPPFDSNSKFDSEKDKSQFRQYATACDRVKSFYAEQHRKQTVSYNLQARIHFKIRPKHPMTIWQAMEKLNTMIDESDPDTSLSQIQHLLQSAEALRRDGKPRWMQCTGLIHDLGKLLFFFDARGQWDVVGDTFPVGCAFDERCIYPETFSANPDSRDPIYGTKFGIYAPHCGMDNVMLSWGHDEYLYHVVKDQSRLPPEALAIIRYHSFYPWHREDAYRDLMDEEGHDEKMLRAVRAFNPYDLYSKSDGIPKIEELKPYYLELIDEFFPQKVVMW